ncbi:MAG: 50S ribosomal protein L30e [Candidatus Thermoplasmatota archaeon]|nr:50S ribosomal protein L30e [Candidatus Thermoplasmatota archaeon]
MDIKRALRNVQETGEVSIGMKQTLKALKGKKGKLVIVSKNCPVENLDSIRKFKVPIYTYAGSNAELGAACGKPFTISAMCVIKGGKSDILTLKGE